MKQNERVILDRFYERGNHSMLSKEVESVEFPISDDFSSNVLRLSVELEFPVLAETLLTRLKSSSTMLSPDNEGGNTALLDAIATKNMDLAIMLLNSGANPNATDCLGITPAMFAAISGNIESLNLLVSKYGADLNVVSKDGSTAFLLAAEKGHLEMIKFLAKNFKVDFIANLDRVTPIQESIEPTDESLYFIAKSKNTLLTRATLSGNVDLVYELLELGANPTVRSSNGSTPLIVAILSKNLGMIKLLYSDPDTQFNAKTVYGASALMIAVRGALEAYQNNQQTNYEEWLDILKTMFSMPNTQMDRDITWDRQKFTPLIAAVFFDNEHITRQLIQYGASVNATNNKQQTALHIAITMNHPNIVKILIENGASTNIADASGKTAEHLVNLSDNKELKEVFLSAVPFSALKHDRISVDNRPTRKLIMHFYKKTLLHLKEYRTWSIGQENESTMTFISSLSRLGRIIHRTSYPLSDELKIAHLLDNILDQQTLDALMSREVARNTIVKVGNGSIENIPIDFIYRFFCDPIVTIKNRILDLEGLLRSIHQPNLGTAIEIKDDTVEVIRKRSSKELDLLNSQDQYYEPDPKRHKINGDEKKSGKIPKTPEKQKTTMLKPPPIHTKKRPDGLTYGIPL